MKLKNLFRRGRLTPPFVNLCGLFFARPKGDLVKYLELVRETLRKISNAGTSGVMVWLPWPLAAPSKTPAHLWEEMITLPNLEKDTWTLEFNSHFRDNIFRPVMDMMEEFNLIPGLGLTGYTNRQILIPVQRVAVDKKNGEPFVHPESLYSEKGSQFVLNEIDYLGIDNNCIIELTNEPEAGMQSEFKLESIVHLTRWHVDLVRALRKDFNQWNFQLNCSDGVNKETFQENIKAVQIAGLLSQALSGKLNIFRPIGEIWEHKKKPVKYDYILSDHNSTSWEQVVRCTSIGRLSGRAFCISLDGSNMKNGGVHSSALYNFTTDIIAGEALDVEENAGLAKILDIEKGVTAREIKNKSKILALHPRGIYDSSGNYWRHTIHLGKLDMKYIDPAIMAYREAYGNPPNYGKSPPEMIIEEEPDGPVIAPGPVAPDPVVPEKKSKLKLIIYALAIIIILVILGAIL